MFEKGTDDDRGQVGIGTLIVFIAMVLVAAIAAGVLINTAGFLQSSAQETGQSSSEQVTNRVQVVSTIGTDVSGGVSTVKVTVKRAPGAANIDLGNTIAQWTDTSGAYDLTYQATADNTHFTVTSIQDDDTSIADSQVLNDRSDRAVLKFDAGAIRGGSNPLPEGSSATIQLNTQSGGTTTVTLAVPETLSGSSAVTL
ncbi:MAG: archaellin/type IV pilin N-terminal domain-containing protein [Haloarculaceae archaeon]